MKNKFKITVNGLPASLEIFQFSGGETQVKVGNPSTSKDYNNVELFALIRDGDIMSLALIKDAIDRVMPNSKVHLKLPYLPYARQDRVMNNGESLAVAVFCKALNTLSFESVTVTDCHSDVGLALINNVTNIIEIPEFKEFYDCIVSPDAGALKKSFKYAKLLGIKEVVRADKTRDVTTGNITGTEVYGNVEGRKCLILDDLVDGGLTFIKLGEKLKERGANQVDLFVHHGIFSKGKDVFKGSIDNIYSAYDWTEI